MTGHAFLPVDPIPDLPPNVTARGQLIKWPERYRARVVAAQVGPAVEQFAGDVEVTGVARRLLYHVQYDPAHAWDFVLHARVVVSPAWRRLRPCTVTHRPDVLAEWASGPRPA